MKNNVIVQKAIKAKEVIAQAQRELLALCQDKNYDINDRFEVWSELVDKTDHPYVIDLDDAPTAIANFTDDLEEKYQTYGWISLMDHAIDTIPEEELGQPELDWSDSSGALATYKAWKTMLLNTHPVLLEVKEWLMQENFGSFKFDW